METISKSSKQSGEKQLAKYVFIGYFLNALARPSGGMADAGDLKSPARSGRMGSNPISAIIKIISYLLVENNRYAICQKRR